MRGLLSGSALLLGAATAYLAHIPQRMIAAVMAFGSGVLISALSGLSRSWGSGSQNQVGERIGFGIEQLSEAGTELAVQDSAADLEQEVSTTTGPPHLL